MAKEKKANERIEQIENRKRKVRSHHSMERNGKSKSERRQEKVRREKEIVHL